MNEQGKKLGFVAGLFLYILMLAEWLLEPIAALVYYKKVNMTPDSFLRIPFLDILFILVIVITFGIFLKTKKIQIAFIIYFLLECIYHLLTIIIFDIQNLILNTFYINLIPVLVGLIVLCLYIKKPKTIQLVLLIVYAFVFVMLNICFLLKLNIGGHYFAWIIQKFSSTHYVESLDNIGFFRFLYYFPYINAIMVSVVILIQTITSYSALNKKPLVYPEASANTVSNNTDGKNIDTVIEFKELLDMGAITQEEFEAKKKELLDL